MPLLPSKHSRAQRSARDVRGIYAPPAAPIGQQASVSPEDSTTALPSPKRKQARPNQPLFRSTEVYERRVAQQQQAWRLNKHDKRLVKHNSLLARVREGKIVKAGAEKRRRPANKLKTDLAGLGDALPEVPAARRSTHAQSERNGQDGWEGLSEDDEVEAGDVSRMEVEGLRTAAKRSIRKALADGEGKIKMRSVRTRPGAMKRRQKLERGETDRFARNLAQMMGKPVGERNVGDNIGDSVGPDAVDPRAERWKALRGFIGNTMERSAAFAGA